MRNFHHTAPLIILLIQYMLIACQTQQIDTSKPNVILILADDIGFECLSINGSTSYKTPVLDSLALNGINFT